jgi:hypothetical protein
MGGVGRTSRRVGRGVCSRRKLQESWSRWAILVVKGVCCGSGEWVSSLGGAESICTEGDAWRKRGSQSPGVASERAC